MRVYLAGPLFTPYERSFIDECVARLRADGIEVFVPHENALAAGDTSPATIFQKDFGTSLDMAVDEKHGFAAQGPRRKAIGKARNFLLYSALKPEHSWVYWRDVDISDSPRKIIEDFVAHDKDILVPSMLLFTDSTLV